MTHNAVTLIGASLADAPGRVGVDDVASIRHLYPGAVTGSSFTLAPCISADAPEPPTVEFVRAIAP